ncbi:hypothetical protein [Streptomyces sp. NPDC053367]|uniref:hypothetical protein n=1 Tax=Streptomyces sp. NPDC053367 TaxID=3365700 RepID=UPI0037D0B981
MNQPVSLIADQSPVPRVAVGPTKATQPHLAVVYATAAGEVECFEGRPMRPTQQWFSRFRTRYEVDMRPHRRTAVLGRNPLVSADGVHIFEVTVSFSFRVDGWQGAENWVRAGLPDALPVVHGYLVGRFHGAGHRFPIEDFHGLERHLNQLVAAPVVLPEGLQIYGCQVSARPDPKSLSHLESLIEAGRREALGAADHVPNRGDLVRGAELDAMRQKFQIDATARQADALAGTLTSSEGLIRHYLVTHPEDAAGAFEMAQRLAEARAATAELQNQRALGLFQVMAEKGLIQSGDLDQMREMLTGTVGRATGGGGQLPSATAPGLTAARPWDPPQLQAGPTPSASLQPGPAASQQPAPSAAYQYAPGAAQHPAPGASAPGAHVQPGAPADPDAFGQGGAPARATPGAGAGGYAPTLQNLPAGAGVPRQQAAPAPFTGAALIYLVVDESLSRECIGELQRGLDALHSALVGAPEVAAVLRLCVLGMAGTTEQRLPLAQVGPGTRTPLLMGRAGLSYAEAFRTLKSLIGQDATLVRSEGRQVLRPVVYFVSGGVPDEGGAWRDAHRELTDQNANPAAPRLVALGLGKAEKQAVAAIATFAEFAFLAAPHQDAVSAAHNVAAFLRDSVVGYGRGLAGGEANFTISAPDGFRRAEDAL